MFPRPWVTRPGEHCEMRKRVRAGWPARTATCPQARALDQPLNRPGLRPSGACVGGQRCPFPTPRAPSEQLSHVIGRHPDWSFRCHETFHRLRGTVQVTRNCPPEHLRAGVLNRGHKRVHMQLVPESEHLSHRVARRGAAVWPEGRPDARQARGNIRNPPQTSGCLFPEPKSERADICRHGLHRSSSLPRRMREPPLQRGFSRF